MIRIEVTGSIATDRCVAIGQLCLRDVRAACVAKVGVNLVDIESYLQFVQSVAAMRNMVFYLDSGEGKDFHDPLTGWHIEDLSGWLIPPDKTYRFEECPQNKLKIGFADAYVFATWTRNGDGKIGVEFQYWNPQLPSRSR